eukprot:symbB.v1.2.027343.t1/scaffold2798.1/size70082/3
MDLMVVELLDKHGSAPAGTSSLAPQAQCFVRAMEQLRKVELKVLLEKVQALGGLEWTGKKATPRTIWQSHRKKLLDDGYLKVGPPQATPAAAARCDDDAPLASLVRMPPAGSAMKKDPAKDGAGLRKNGENQKASASDPHGRSPETPSRSNDLSELPQASKPKAKARVIKTILKQKQKEEDRSEEVPSDEPWKEWVKLYPKENLVRLDTGILPGMVPPRARSTISALKLGGSFQKAKEVAEKMAELINAGVEEPEWRNVRELAYEEYASKTTASAAGPDSTERPTGATANIPMPKAKAKGKAKAKAKAKAATKITEKKLDEKVEQPETKPDKKMAPDASKDSKAEKKPDKAEGSKVPKEASSKQAEKAEGSKGPKTMEVPVPTDAKAACSCQGPKAEASASKE